jgi:O-antigen/teichoic acid export membrane protein
MMLRRVRHRRDLAIDTGWGLFQEGSAVVTAIISFSLLARTLGGEQYGAYLGLIGLLTPAQAFAGRGGLSFLILEAIARDREDPRDVIGSTTAIALIAGSAMVVPVLLLARATVPLLSSVAVLLFISSELVFGNYSFSLIAVVQAKRSFGAAARLRGSIQLARAGLIVVLAVAGHLTIMGVAVGYTVMRALVAMILSFVVSRMIGRRIAIGRPRVSHIRGAATYSVELTANGIQQGSDLTVLNANNLALDAGLYGAAFRLITLGTTPIRALVGATHVRVLERGSGKGDNDQLGYAIRLAAMGLAWGVVFSVSALLAAPLVPKLMGSDFEGTAGMVRWLVPYALLVSVKNWPMNAIMGFGRRGVRAAIRVGNAVLAMSLYLVLIPSLSWKGAVIGTTITEATVVTASWATLVVLQRQHNKRSRSAADVGLDQKSTNER